MNSEITRDDWERYVLILYFGGKNEPLENCINRAYRDFNRTLHKYSKIVNNKELTMQIKSILKREFEKVKTKNINSQSEFDKWHKDLCNLLVSLYMKNDYTFYLGQAQKWINMTFKYIFTYGEKYLKRYASLYEYCHVPIDNILIEELKSFIKSKFDSPWSRISDYESYINYQEEVRTKFNKIPLDKEFELWLDGIKKV